MDTETPGYRVSAPGIKLFIGFVAGLCAALFPRLTAALATQDEHLIFFPLSYLILALVFATLIGVVVMILEWGVRAKPAETFMMALGIPALLTGALNATLSTRTVKDLVQQQEQLTRELSQQTDIPIRPASPVRAIEGSLQPASEPLRLALWEVRLAYAQISDYTRQQSGFNPGIQIQQRPYLVVLDHAATQEQALTKARRLRSQLPRLQIEVVKTDTEFLLVQGGGPRSKSEALLAAIQLKKDHNLSPALLEVGAQPR